MILTSALNPLTVHRDSQRISILGRILRVTDEVIRYRRWVEQQFSISHSPILSTTINNYQLTSVRAPRSLSSSGSTSSVDSGASSEVITPNLYVNHFADNKPHFVHQIYVA